MRAYFFIFILLFSPCLYAEMFEIDSINDIWGYVDASSDIVVFDVDSTLLVASQMLGSDPWYEEQIQKAKDTGLTHDDAVAQTQILWARVQMRTRMIPAENETTDVLWQLQQRGITVIALSERTPDLAYRTLEQLKENGVELSNISLPDRVSTFENGSKYIGGGLFVGPTNDKGGIFVKLLKEREVLPQKLIFVDDSKEKLAEFDRALDRAGVKSFSLLYKGTVKAKEAYDGALAQFQLDHMDFILSDDDARKVLSRPMEKTVQMPEKTVEKIVISCQDPDEPAAENDTWERFAPLETQEDVGPYRPKAR